MLLCALPNVLIQDFFYPEVLTEKILSIFSIFLLAEGISFHPEISTVPISSQILLQTEILTAKNGLCASPLLLKLKALPAIKANQRFLPQKSPSVCLFMFRPQPFSRRFQVPSG